MEVRPYKNHLGFKNKILRVLWHFVYLLFFRPFPNILFWEWRVFLLRCFGAKIVKSGLLQCSGPHGMWKWEIM